MFKDMVFTPNEFALLAKMDKSLVPALEGQGYIKTHRKKIGNVDRKVISMEEIQNFFRMIREFDTAAHESKNASEMGSGAEVAGSAIIATDAVAAATDIFAVHPNKKTQMFYNVKGGTGKSTLTAQFVMMASLFGYKVLAIDLDGQGHLTVNLDVLDAHERPTIYDVLINDLPLADAVMNVAPGLDLIPANLGLCNIEIPLNNKTRREYRLSEAIAKIADQYDLIIADTNPAASILNGSMLVASDRVNVICATNPLSFHGMSLVMATIDQMKKEFGRDLDVKIIPNMYDNREVISQEVLGELRSQFEDVCAKAVVNRSADMNEATKRRTTVWDVNTKGTAAQDIAELTHELLR
ncbi:MAG: ParA family protein [Bdellovibrionales bacterium]|nr:ParA family protein [Bdellovibrionales bacterium]